MIKINITNDENYPLGSKENPRHILGLSGGKDSTALAIHIMNTRPDVHEKIEYYFTDTGTELEEIYTYLDKLEKYLGKKVQLIKATVDENKKLGFRATNVDDEQVPFDDVLYDKFNGFLPAPNARWCTRYLKIEPMEKWINGEYCVSYIGLRADEPQRVGYDSKGKKNVNITPVYPFREDNIDIQKVFQILEETVGMPEYYKWKTRSGCFFCFYQRRVEYAILYFLYPELFKYSKKYETEHSDGRKFTWVKDKPLEYIEDNAKEIIKRYVKKQYKKLTFKELTEMTMTLDEINSFIDEGKIREFVDTWNLYRLHNAGEEEAGKDGCTVCAI